MDLPRYHLQYQDARYSKKKPGASGAVGGEGGGGRGEEKERRREKERKRVDTRSCKAKLPSRLGENMTEILGVRSSDHTPSTL